MREAVDAVVLEDADRQQREHHASRRRCVAGPLRAHRGPSPRALPREAEEALERAKKALTVLATVGGRIAAVTPVDDIIDAIVDLVFEATPAERAALFLWDEERAPRPEAHAHARPRARP